MTETPLVTLPGTFKPGERVSSGIRAVIYGPGGAGKTTLLGSMPGRGLIMDIPQIEGGDFVLKNHADRIDVIRVESWVKVQGSPEDQPGLQEVFNYLKYKNHGYKWVGIDSLTGWTELARRKVVGERANALVLDPHKTTLPEWGTIGGLISEMIYQFHTLPMHVFWTAQERAYGGDKDPADAHFIGPSTSPAALAALLPPQRLIGRLSVEKQMDGSSLRQLRVGSSSTYKTKVRAVPDVDMPAIIANPDLGMIFRYMLGGPAYPRPEEVKESAIFVLG